MDSFDHYATADILEKWTTQSTGAGTVAISINATGGRRSSPSFRMTCVNPSGAIASNISKTITPSDAVCIIGFSYLISTTVFMGTAGIPVLSIRDGASPQVTLRLNSALQLIVYRGTSAGTSLGTSSIGLSTGVTAYIELKVTINNTTGTVDLRVNGASGLSLTSQNTRNTANTAWTGISFGNVDAVANTWVNAAGTMDHDDIYVLDGTGSAPYNTFLGDCRVDGRRGTAPGATTGWTPSTGANWQNVDDTAPDDDTTYNSAASTGLTDTFVTEDAPVAGATIYGIQHNISMKKSDAGICTIAPVIRHSGVDNAGSSMSPGTSYAYGLQIATEIAPGVAITESNFNAAEFGYTRLT
jgi:hypothetical protein